VVCKNQWKGEKRNPMKSEIRQKTRRRTTSDINFLFFQQPIDEDKQVVDFALFNGVHVSMDASTLRHLLSAPWSQRNQTYACKVKITSRVFSGF